MSMQEVLEEVEARRLEGFDSLKGFETAIATGSVEALNEISDKRKQYVSLNENEKLHGLVVFGAYVFTEEGTVEVVEKCQKTLADVELLEDVLKKDSNFLKAKSEYVIPTSKQFCLYCNKEFLLADLYGNPILKLANGEGHYHSQCCGNS